RVPGRIVEVAGMEAGGAVHDLVAVVGDAGEVVAVVLHAVERHRPVADPARPGVDHVAGVTPARGELVPLAMPRRHRERDLVGGDALDGHPRSRYARIAATRSRSRSISSVSWRTRRVI